MTAWLFGMLAQRRGGEEVREFDSQDTIPALLFGEPPLTGPACGGDRKLFTVGTMNRPEDFMRVSQLFEAARQLSSTERETFLHQECAGAEDVRRQVEALLKRHDAAGVLDAPISSSVTRRSGQGIATPERIGRYRLLHVVGAGGMGTVYAAEQEQPRRTVALKVMRSGLMDAAAQRRFEFEAEVLGRLHHLSVLR